jgi:hypothetical protein
MEGFDLVEDAADLGFEWGVKHSAVEAELVLVLHMINFMTISLNSDKWCYRPVPLRTCFLSHPTHKHLATVFTFLSICTPS